MAPRSVRADTLVTWAPQELKETVVPGYGFRRTVSLIATRDLDHAVVSVPPTLAPFVRAEPSRLTGIKKGQGVEVTLIISAPATAKLRSVAGSIRLQPAGSSALCVCRSRSTSPSTS
jgi:hypothetical protein